MQHDTLKVSYETIKTKSEVTLVEREKEITALKEQLGVSAAKERSLAEKIEAIEQKNREEHQRMVEMYEGSGRYKDVRELYESKLGAKEAELMSAKESLLQAKLNEEQRVKQIAQLEDQAEKSAAKHAEAIAKMEKKLKEDAVSYSATFDDLRE